MTPTTSLKLALLVPLLGMALLAPARAQPIGQAPQGAPRVPVTHSVEQADATLAQVARERVAVHARYAQDEQVCYGKFFVNRCLDQARERRRVALADLRAAEVEASHFKRQDSVNKRDAELAERARKDEEEQAARAAQPRPAKTPVPADGVPQSAPKAGPSLAERQAGHDAREQRHAAEQAAGAAQRAANVAAYERKQRESAERKAVIARKKQEAGARRAAREEAERKKAEAAASALKR